MKIIGSVEDSGVKENDQKILEELSTLVDKPETPDRKEVLEDLQKTVKQTNKKT